MRGPGDLLYDMTARVVRYRSAINDALAVLDLHNCAACRQVSYILEDTADDRDEASYIPEPTEQVLPDLGSLAHLDALLTTKDVSVLFGVDARTVALWAKSGKLTVVRTPSGRPRYRAKDVQALLGS